MIAEWLLTFFIVGGIFLLAYMNWRGQGLLETFQEIKEMFQDKVEDVGEAMAYK